MRVAIYGLAKTGTSALYYKIREAMPASTLCHFEPDPNRERKVRLYRLLEKIGIGHRRPKLVKVLIGHPSSDNMDKRFGAFDKSILITRDPRDRLISGLLYRVYETDVAKDPEASAKWIALLARKEAEPAALPVIELLTEFGNLAGQAFDFVQWRTAYSTTNIDRPIAFADTHDEMFPFRYEDLVDQNFEALNRYLGLDLSGQAEVDGKLSRVVRTRGYGNWRDWFTQADVDALGPMLQPYLDRYYPESDWLLNPVPAIDPAHASHYVQRIVSEGFAKKPASGNARFWKASP